MHFCNNLIGSRNQCQDITARQLFGARLGRQPACVMHVPHQNFPGARSAAGCAATIVTHSQTPREAMLAYREDYLKHFSVKAGTF
jgi:hypothetical protein